MAVKTRALVDVQCDVCGQVETLETEETASALDRRGYRRVRVAVAPFNSELSEHCSESKELVACSECLKKLRASINMISAEDEAERQLSEMKRAARSGSA